MHTNAFVPAVRKQCTDLFSGRTPTTSIGLDSAEILTKVGGRPSNISPRATCANCMSIENA
jgi:hypothetical protein